MCSTCVIHRKAKKRHIEVSQKGLSYSNKTRGSCRKSYCQQPETFHVMSIEISLHIANDSGLVVIFILTTTLHLILFHKRAQISYLICTLSKKVLFMNAPKRNPSSGRLWPLAKILVWTINSTNKASPFCRVAVIRQE